MTPVHLCATKEREKKEKKKEELNSNDDNSGVGCVRLQVRRRSESTPRASLQLSVAVCDKPLVGAKHDARN